MTRSQVPGSAIGDAHKQGAFWSKRISPLLCWPVVGLPSGLETRRAANPTPCKAINEAFTLPRITLCLLCCLSWF